MYQMLLQANLSAMESKTEFGFFKYWHRGNDISIKRFSRYMMIKISSNEKLGSPKFNSITLKGMLKIKFSRHNTKL